jgi:soluble lytic murein transglycosylase-like protein
MATHLIPPGFRFYKDLIHQYADQHGLDPALVAAVCWQESSFCANGYRFEPNFWNRYLKLNPKYRELNPARVSASYGLMQIMYPLVHEDKLADNDALPPEHLFVPELNLKTGCAWLAGLFRWAGTLGVEDIDVVTQAVLAAYNGGRGGNNPTKNWPLRNASYAREVLAKHAIMVKQYANIPRIQPVD